MTKKIAMHWFRLVTYGILLYTAVNHIPEILEILRKIYQVSAPIVTGLVLAFVINAPLSTVAQLCRKVKIKGHKLQETTIEKLSLLITLLLLSIIVAIALILIIPNVYESFVSLIAIIQIKLPTWLTWLNEQGIDTNNLEKFILNIDINKLTSSDGILSWALSTASKTVTTTVSFAISVIIALYALIDRKKIWEWVNKIACIIFDEDDAIGFIVFIEKVQTSYSDFFAGQCIESCILGVLMFTTLTIAQIPYASLIAVLTALFAFIPYIGAWFACGVGCILMLVSSPEKIIVCIIVYFITQMFENYLIYPHVVGKKVDLSPLFTLGAVIVGGSLFGVFGMIFFIPLVAVLRDIFTESIENTIQKKREQKNLENKK